nr:hypothetical protein [uncultured Psychroserpens sp.]
MKYILAIILVLNSIVVYAQDVVGKYHMEIGSTNVFLSRTLTLNADGTFIFHGYEKHEHRIPNEVNVYGKGTWTIDKKVISLSSEILDDKYTLNFDKSKARFIAKSPRDKSDRDIKTAIQLYDSDVMIANGLKLIKE